MKQLKTSGLGAIALCVIAVGTPARAEEKMPPHFSVHQTDFGAVFTDENGMTLYQPVGRVGDGAGVHGGCEPYVSGNGPDQGPVGADLNMAFRGSATCADKFPIVLAGGDAKPVGKWTIVTRSDGRKQWAYDGHSLFRSIRDSMPGDVNGVEINFDRSIGEPVFVPVATVPGVQLVRNGLGQYLTTAGGMSLYTFDEDGRGKSACENSCTNTWQPLLTGTLVKSTPADWSVVTRGDGARQWAYKGKPLYTNVNDIVTGYRKGDGVKGWHVALLSPPVGLPAEVTTRDTWLGQAYADAKDGHSLYTFSCKFGVQCDDPADSASYWRYWYSFCGEPEDCAKMFHPLLAPKNAKAIGRTWTVVKIKAPWAPVRLADNVQERSLSVWAYKGRPLFTFSGDEKPGNFNAIGFERGSGSFRWTAFGPLGDINVQVAQ